MKLAPTYLTRNRHGTFYFRMVIPAPLRLLINGKREIRRSLKTDSQRLALKLARQHAAHFDSIFDRALRMTEHSDYVPCQEDLDLYEELHGNHKRHDAGAWSSPITTPAKPEPVLSDAEIEKRQRRQYIAELLTGRYDRPIPSELEPVVQQLLELTRTYQTTKLPSVLPRLHEALALSSLTPVSSVAASEPAPSSDLKPEANEWTLYQVWEEELRQEHELKDTKSGGPANNEGTRKDYDRKARCATILTNHKPVGSLTKDDWRQAYRSACKLKRGATASVEAGKLTTLDELATNDREELAYDGAYLFPGAQGRPFSEMQAQLAFTSLSGEQWTSHDLRKTARTAWADLGVDYLIGELLLNHALKALDVTYIHTTAEAQKRQALERWHAWLDGQGFAALHSPAESGQAETKQDRSSSDPTVQASGGGAGREGQKLITG